ncbi:putative glucose-6-phosphate dehydrogenase (NADP(+)) [Helianthus anomalus]
MTGCRYLTPRKGGEETHDEDVSKFLPLIKYISGPYDADEGFQSLDEAISAYEMSKDDKGGSSKRLFYFALPPSVYPPVCKMIKRFCMNKSEGGWTRVVVEKPFGKDLESSEALSTQIGDLFNESQIYRIDHYLGKELVQNLLVLRFANRLFMPLWNHDNISTVQIVFKEDFGTEGRGGYFDEYGYFLSLLKRFILKFVQLIGTAYSESKYCKVTLTFTINFNDYPCSYRFTYFCLFVRIIRDILQNHLLQVLCLVAMERPVSLKPEHIRDEKLKVLQSVIPIKDEEVVLGQYEGYTDDPTVPNDSNTPTFATVVIRIHNERWEGVPFILKAGKSMKSRKAEIRVQFKDVAGDIFKPKRKGRNEFVIRLQPSEAIYMKLTVKEPGLEMKTTQSELDLSYRQRYQDVIIPEAYERLILDTIRGDQQHFVRRDELKAAWEIFTPLLHKIDNNEIQSLPYKPGSRGPDQADTLAEKVGYVQTHGYVWTTPTLSAV